MFRETKDSCIQHNSIWGITVQSIDRLVAVAILTGFVSALTGCGVPLGGHVFSIDPLAGGGLVEVTEEHEGHYVRAVGDYDRFGKRGGSTHHSHSYAHVHDGELTDADPKSRPLGLSDSASSGGHRHKYQTVEQSVTLTSAHPNEFPNLGLRLFCKQRIGFCVPAGTIIGYVGDQAPDGWALLDGREGRPNADGLYLRITGTQLGGNHGIGDSHRHPAEHEHKLLVRLADKHDRRNRQLFAPQNNGGELATVDHGHLTKTFTESKSSTSERRVELPRVELTLLIATENHLTLPIGAVIPFKRWLFTPLGYRCLQGTIEGKAPVPDFSDRFPMASGLLKTPLLVEAPSTHDHGYKHAHDVTLKQTEQKAAGKHRKSPNGNPVAVQSHTHTHRIEHADNTQSTHHLPQYVELTFIIKRF